MTFPKMVRVQVDDPYVQENFKRLGDFARSDAITRSNFQFLSIDVPGPGAKTNFRPPHHLNFRPLDVLLLSNSTNATVAFNYNLFDDTYLDINSSGPTTLRLLVGRYE